MSWAQKLKERYASKWAVAATREFFVFNLLNLLTTRIGCFTMFTGVGSGLADIIPWNYSNPVNAFDFTIVCKGKVTAFIDVTGYSDYSRGLEDTKPCILYRKIEKAELLEIPLEKVWFIHFVDSRISMRFINARLVNELLSSGKAEKRKLYSDENWYVCIDQKRWLEPRNFIKWLLAVRDVG